MIRTLIGVAATFAVAAVTAPVAGADPGTVSVPGDAVICHAPSGTVPGDRIDCAILPAALDALMPGDALPAPTDWPASEDAPARASWVCSAAQLPGHLNCEF